MNLKTKRELIVIMEKELNSILIVNKIKEKEIVKNVSEINQRELIFYNQL